MGTEYKRGSFKTRITKTYIHTKHKDRNNIKINSKQREREIILPFAVLWVKDHNPH